MLLPPPVRGQGKTSLDGIDRDEWHREQFVTLLANWRELPEGNIKIREMSVISACGLSAKSQSCWFETNADRTRKRLKRAMKPIVKTLLRRSLLTLGAILVWAKALAGGRADAQTPSMPETDQKTAGGRQQKPNGEP